MKKCIYLLAILLVFVVVLSSCSQDLNAELVGSWQAENGNRYLTFTASRILTVNYPDDPSMSISYRYTVEKGVITLQFGVFSSPMEYSISGNLLTLDGEKYYKM